MALKLSDYIPALKYGATIDVSVDLTDISDHNGNEAIEIDGVTSAVNFVRVTNAAASGIPVLSGQGDDTDVSIAIDAKGDGAVVLGSTGYGRVSTKTAAGSAITLDSSYTRGEAWELRYTSTKSNTQVQGIFLEMRTSVANTSTIRGAEIKAAQEGAVAVGVLEGANFSAVTRSTSTGAITNMFGVTGEITHNSDAYTGTVTLAAAVRGKFSAEDGTTYTASSVFLAEGEAISGAATVGSILRGRTISGVTFSYAIDVKDATLAETNSGKNVTLIRFTGANGTAYRLVHDTDSATAVSVVTD